MTDHELAARLATEAGAAAARTCARELADASAAERKAAGDKRVPRLPDGGAGGRAARRRGAVGGGRRGAADPAATADRVWIVDPLDGTREFSELGRDDWAVHVALWQAGELVAGAVALPGAGRHAGHPGRSRRRPPPPGAPRVVVSRTRPPAVALAVRDALDGTLVEMGSAGAKVASVVQGVSDVYVHAGGQTHMCVNPSLPGERSTWAIRRRSWPPRPRRGRCRVSVRA